MAFQCFIACLNAKFQKGKKVTLVWFLVSAAVNMFEASISLLSSLAFSKKHAYLADDVDAKTRIFATLSCYL